MIIPAPIHIPPGPNIPPVTPIPPSPEFPVPPITTIPQLPPPPPRKLTAAEIRQREFGRAESAARSLPLYGNEANAVAVRENFKFARQNRDHEYYMEIINKAWSEFKSKKK